MTRLPIVLTMLMAALSLATAARAAEDENAADIRCVVVAFGMMQSTDPQVKALATGAGLYFVGRIRGRSPDLDLESAIANEAGRMAPEDYRDDLQRCGHELQAEGGRLKDLVDDLKKKGAAQSAPDAAPK